MAQQARIVDFEEARSSSSRRTSSGRSSSQKGSSGKGRQTSGKGRSGSASGASARSGRRGSSRATAAARGGRAGSAEARRTRTTKDSRQASGSKEQASSARGSSRRGKGVASKIEKIKRDLAKKKAGRLFDRDVTQEAPSGDEPRAALYKTKMGSSHKKASRMQAGDRKISLPGLPSIAPYLSKLNSKAGVAAIVCACLVFSCAFLYLPAKNYYAAVRDRARAEVAYDMVTTRSEALKKDVAALVTDEGMEDRAREQYGWIKQGENAVVVTGLSENAEPSAAEVLRTTTLNDVHAPETWYSPMLDAVFGYEA